MFVLGINCKLSPTQNLLTMKNVFSVFTFLLVSNFVFGQIEWVGNHNFTESATDLVRTSQGHYILVHDNGSGITVFKESGEIIFEKLLNVYQNQYYQQISDIMELTDSSIVFAAGAMDCDIFIERFHKFDKDWNEVPFANFYGGAGQAAQFSDNSMVFYGYSNNYLIKLDADGNTIWDLGSISNVHDLVVMVGDTILLATAQGLKKLDAGGTMSEQYPNLIFDRLEILANENLLAQIGDTLRLFSPGLVPLATQHFNGIKDITFDENEIMVLTATPAVVRHDLNLSELGSTPLSGLNQSFKAIAFTNSGFMLGGGEKYGIAPNENESAFIKEFTMDGSAINTAEDAALTSVQFSNSQSDVINWWDFSYEVVVHDLQVTVENVGPTIINQLTVNFHHNTTVFLWECSELQSFSKSFDNLNLQPGASMVLDWGDQSLLFQENPAGLQVELCFWTSLPNHHLETNNDNDVACTEVSVAAHEPFPITFHHAFNPVADELYIDLPTELDYTAAKAHIFNAAGQLVYTEAITALRETLPLHDLPDGVYFLQIVSGERVGWGKFAKY